MNKVIMLGNIVRDFTLKSLPSGTQLAEPSIACNRVWKDKDGNKQEDVCFVDCKIYGEQAENMVLYFGKGKPVLIEGRLQQEQWENKNGVQRSKHVIVIDRWEFVGSKSSEEEHADATLESTLETDNEEVPF